MFRVRVSFFFSPLFSLIHTDEREQAKEIDKALQLSPISTDHIEDDDRPSTQRHVYMRGCCLTIPFIRSCTQTLTTPESNDLPQPVRPTSRLLERQYGMSRAGDQTLGLACRRPSVVSSSYSSGVGVGLSSRRLAKEREAYGSYTGGIPVPQHHPHPH